MPKLAFAVMSIALLAAGCATRSDAPQQQQSAATPATPTTPTTAAAARAEPRTGSRLKNNADDRWVRSLDGRGLRLDTVSPVGTPAGVAQ